MIHQLMSNKRAETHKKDNASVKQPQRNSGTGEVPKWDELKVETRSAMNAEDGVITEGCRDQNT